MLFFYANAASPGVCSTIVSCTIVVLVKCRPSSLSDVLIDLSSKFLTVMLTEVNFHLFEMNCQIIVYPLFMYEHPFLLFFINFSVSTCFSSLLTLRNPAGISYLFLQFSLQRKVLEGLACFFNMLFITLFVFFKSAQLLLLLY